MKPTFSLLLLVLALSIFGATDYFAVDYNTVALWRFNENSGDSVHDVSGNGYHGKFNKVPYWSTLSGVSGSGVLFDGATYAKVQNTGVFNLSGSFVLEARIQVPTGYYPGTSRIIGCHRYGYNTTGYIWGSSGSLFESYNSSLGKTTSSSSYMSFANDTWNVVKMAYDSAAQKVRFYLNGVQVDSLSRNLNNIEYGRLPLIIGGELNSDSSTGTYLFYGVIDEIKISRIAPCSGSPLALASVPAQTFNRKPLFQWYADSRVSTYKFILSANASMTDPILNLPLADTFYQPSINLPYGTLYYRVMDYDNAVCPSLVKNIMIQDSMQPAISVTPGSLSAEVGNGDSVIKTLSLCNPGRDTLVFGLNRSGLGTSPRILAWTYYADLAEEYAHTISAIRQYTPGCSIVTTNTLIADSLRSKLVGKHAFLITEPTSTLSSTYGSTLGPVLQEFVSAGGVVVFCLPSSYNSAFINATGLMRFSSSSSTSSSILTKTLPNHDLLKNTTTTLTACDATGYFSLLDSSTTVVSYSGYTVVAEKQIGLGHVVALGADFYAYDSNWAHIVSNAVQMSSSAPSWISCSQDTGMVLPGQCLNLSVTFKPGTLSGSLFTGQLAIRHNAPLVANPFLVPCSLTLPPPVMGLSARSVSANLKTGDSLVRSVTILNTGKSPLNLSLQGSTSLSSVVINEVSTSSDFVELWNRGPEIDLTGWRLIWTDNSGSSGSFVVPAGVKIRAGKVQTLYGYPGTSNDSLIYMGFYLNWGSSTSLSLKLVNPDGNAVDFFRAGTDTTRAPAGTSWYGSLSTGYGWYRVKDFDSDSSSDWVSIPTSSGFTYNAINPGQSSTYRTISGNWLRIQCDTLSIQPGASASVRFVYQPMSQLVSGVYCDTLFIQHNAKNLTSPITVLCSLTLRSTIPAIIPVQPDPTSLARPTLAWHPIESAGYYSIQIALAPDFSSTFITQPVSDTVYVPNVNLPRGYVYWRVKSDLSTFYSRVDTFLIQSDSIPTLVPVTPELTLARRPLFSWHPARGAAVYKIQIDTSGLFSTPIVTLPVTDTFFVPTFNLPYGRIVWRVSNVTYSETSYSAPDTFTVVSGTSTEDEVAVLPETFGLSQNYPNPFNPSTTLFFAVPACRNGEIDQRVTMKIYDLKGCAVRTLMNRSVAPGYHSVVFDGRNDQGGLLPSGIYLCSMTADHFHRTLRMFMMK